MSRDSGTRSGMLWEVERLLKECEELPQILVMENVSQVHGKGNIEHFQEWIMELEKLGYTSFYDDLNSKNFCIPQNRERTFMISILGKYNYKMSKTMKLKYRLKDMLEKEVSKKYYLSDKMIQGMKKTNFESYKLENKLKDINGVADTIIARFDGTPQCIKVPEATKKGYAEAQEGDGVYINRPYQKRGVVQKGMIQTLKTSPDVGVVVENDYLGTYKFAQSDNFMKGKDRFMLNKEYSDTILTQCKEGVVTVGNYSPSGHNASRIVDSEGIAPTVMENHGTVTAAQLENLRIRKLTPKECFRLMGVKDDDFNKVKKNQSNSSLYHLAGDSIVTTCLMAIFGQMLDIDYEQKINKLVEEIIVKE